MTTLLYTLPSVFFLSAACRNEQQSTNLKSSNNLSDGNTLQEFFLQHLFHVLASCFV